MEILFHRNFFFRLITVKGEGEIWWAQKLMIVLTSLLQKFRSPPFIEILCSDQLGSFILNFLNKISFLCIDSIFLASRDLQLKRHGTLFNWSNKNNNFISVRFFLVFLFLSIERFAVRWKLEILLMMRANYNSSCNTNLTTLNCWNL